MDVQDVQELFSLKELNVFQIVQVDYMKKLKEILAKNVIQVVNHAKDHLHNIANHAQQELS